MSHPLATRAEATATGPRRFYVHVSDGPSASGVAIGDVVALHLEVKVMDSGGTCKSNVSCPA